VSLLTRITFSLQVLKFSPDGQYLAVGSRDGCIYVYQVMDDLTRFARLGKCQVSIAFKYYL
jgi:microtubule-associated protein-like 1/2